MQQVSKIFLTRAFTVIKNNTTFSIILFQLEFCQITKELHNNFLKPLLVFNSTCKKDEKLFF